MRFVGVAVVAAILTTISAADRPNLLMIAIDDLRPMLGCYGDAQMHTPNIDALAHRGMVFDRAYCQYAKCGTSRLSLMTGLRPDAVGVFSNDKRDVADFRRRNPGIASLARWLKQAGYHAQSFGKIYHDEWDDPDDWSVPSSPGRPREMWEVVDDRNPLGPTRIADRLDCPVIQSPDVADDHLYAGRMTGEAIGALERAPRDRPFFIAVGFRRPHLPLIAPARYFDLYRAEESWLAKNAAPPFGSPAMAWFNSDGYVGSAKKIGLEMPLRPKRDQAIAWNGYELRSYVGVPNHGEIPESKQLALVHAYRACISYVDAQVGRLLDRLNASGMAENTIVVLWSDHGWHLGEMSAWGKMTNFEIATRVPMIISAPGIAAGRTDTIAELVDLYPTICDLAGVDPPEHLQGESLLSVLKYPEAPSDSIALSQYARFRDQFMGRAIRDDRYRFVGWIDSTGGQLVHRELYDHDVDPGETNNIAERNPRITEAMQRRMRQAFKLDD